MARPSALTPELRERIERELAEGVPVVVVAQNVGVSKSALHNWIGSGRIVRRRPADPLDFAEEEPADERAEFDLDQRLGAAEGALVGVVLRAAGRGSWQAAMSILERKWPEKWSRPSRARPVEQVSIAPSKEMQEVLGELDELSRARRERRGR